MKNVSFLDMTAISGKCFNRFGVHLNWFGKGILSQKICQAIKAFVANRPDGIDKKVPPVGRNSTKHPVLDTSFFNSNNKFKVDNINIITAISSFQENPSVAFAHSISSDFGEERHMSRGVAVVFGRMFGKPCASDCVHSHLTYQQEEGKAGIYGLVTKPTYNSKPVRVDYDIAFEQFSNSFSKNGFKHLICSPMGCVRDRIEIDHFVSNLKKFQERTGATINIITSSRHWNPFRVRMSHEEFVRGLRTQIGKPMKIIQKNANYQYNKSTISSSSPWRGWSTPVYAAIPSSRDCSTPLTPTPRVVPGGLSFSDAVKSHSCADPLSANQSVSDSVLVTGDHSTQQPFLYLSPQESPHPRTN